MKLARRMRVASEVSLLGQKLLSLGEIRQALDETLHIQLLRTELNRARNMHMELASKGQDSEAENIRNTIRKIIDELDGYFDARITDSPTIRSKIEIRDSIKQSMHTRTCTIGSQHMSFSCAELLRNLERTEGIILALRNELFWENHSLKNFRSDDKHPHPGHNQPAGDYIDVKSVIDGARPIAILGRTIRPAVAELVSTHNLSCLTAEGSDRCTIFYNNDAYDTALHIAEIIETKGDTSPHPNIIYEFHKRIGTLMGMNTKVVEKFAREACEHVA